MSLNSVCLIGRMTRDPETSFTASGDQVTSFSMAVNTFKKRADGNGYEADFFDVKCWRKTAEFVSSYLAKGRLVSVSGRLTQERWTDQATNQNRSKVTITAENVEGLESKKDLEERGEATPAARPAQRPAAVEVEDELDPFAE